MKPTIPGSNCASNGFLAAEVANTTDSAIGRVTFAKGSCPLSPADDDAILFPLGTSFNTIRVFDTNTDYVEGDTSTVAPFSVVDLDTQSPTLVTATSTLVTVGWKTSAENLTINQEVEVQGTTAASSRIRMTMTVMNDDESAHTVAIRDMLDLFIGGYDGTWIRFYSGTTPGTITGTESDFTAPYSFTAFAMSGCSTDPCTPSSFGTGTFTLYGSVSSPTGSTTPSRFVYGLWSAMFATAFNYTSVTRQIGSTTKNVGGSLDSALLYYFGPTTLNPGQSTSATIFVSNSTEAIIQPPVTNTAPSFDQPPTPACGSTVPVDQLGTLTFTVQASDPDTGDSVTLDVAGLPAGATMTPTLPTSGNPVSSTFSWTPPVSSAGDYAVVFSATDNADAQTFCGIRITVSLFVIPESPLGTLLLLLLPIAALILFTKARPIRLR